MKLSFMTLFLLHAICMQMVALFGGMWRHFFLSNASKVFQYDTSKHPITSLLQTGNKSTKRPISDHKSVRFWKGRLNPPYRFSYYEEQKTKILFPFDRNQSILLISWDYD